MSKSVINASTYLDELSVVTLNQCHCICINKCGWTAMVYNVHVLVYQKKKTECILQITKDT